MSTVPELVETPIHELTETELDEVSGGLWNFGNSVVQLNIPIVIGVSVLSGDILQDIDLGNFSWI